MAEGGEVILFYKYVPIADPAAVEASQRSACERLGLSGRMRIAEEGINGSVFGPPAAVEGYVAFMEASELFQGIQYKYSKSDEDPFGGQVALKRCSEITATGPMKRALPTALGGAGGEHLRPEQFHDLVKRAGEDDSIVVLDTRNHYETAVGTFKRAVDPKIRNFAQLPVWLDANKEMLRGKHVAMFCTGGIRCEKASAYVKSLGVAKEVSQLEGGIHSYLEAFSDPARSDGVRTKRLKGSEVAPPTESRADDECLFEGINFQFDNRLSRPVVGRGKGADSFTGARCLNCAAPFSTTRKNAVCVVCKDFVLLCDDCIVHFDAVDPALQTGAAPCAPPANAIRCFEHQLLADNWKEYLARLDVSDDELARHVRALRRLEAQCAARRSSKRQKNKRRGTLRLQIERLLELLRNRGRDDLCDALEVATRTEEAQNEFVPFVPFFEWRAKSDAARPPPTPAPRDTAAAS